MLSKNTNDLFLLLSEGGTACFRYQIQNKSTEEISIIRATPSRAKHGKGSNHIVGLQQMFM